MKIGIRNLTAREHYLAAPVLVLLLTLLMADVMLPEAARLKSASPVFAVILSLFPLGIFLLGLLILLPRSANNSHWNVIRLAGRIPLPVRFVLLGAVSVGLGSGIIALFHTF
jgi:hypothetical protein